MSPKLAHCIRYFVMVLILPSSVRTNRRAVFHKCWSLPDNITGNAMIGLFADIEYQLAIVNERQYVELQCRTCNDTNHSIGPYRWSRIDVIRNSFTDDSSKNINATLSKLKSGGSVKKGFTLTETGALFFKAKPKKTGLYVCREPIANNQVLDVSSNMTINMVLIGYYLTVISRKEQPMIGSVSDWMRYRNDIIEPIRDDVQLLAMFGSGDLRLSNRSDDGTDLFFSWTTWGRCVCGSFKYDTLRYRTGYCCVRIDEPNGNVLVLPCADPSLMIGYPEYATAVANVSTFREYQRCMEDCVPEALEDSVEWEYKFKVTYNVPHLGHLELRCPKSNESTDVLWLRDEEILLNRSDSRLAGGSRVANSRICVDTKNTLHLSSLTTKEGGYYSCLVDGVPMAKHLVRITAREIVLTAECLKSLTILAIVMMVCFLIYSIVVYTSVQSMNERN